MNETAAQLVDNVLPQVPVRQWVLSLPPFLRYRVAYDSKLCSQILSIFLQEVFRWYRWQAKETLDLKSVQEAFPGSVTWIQRFSSALSLNLHFHALAFDGVYIENDGKPLFRALPAPSHQAMQDVVARVHRRAMDLVVKRGFNEDGAGDDLTETEPLLAACAMASIQGRVAHGDHAGKRIERLRTEVPRPQVLSTRCVEVERFNLHANVRIAGSDRTRLERLCRYTSRPPVATERLGPLSDGRLGYRLKRPWSDGTTFVVFDRITFIEKLVALVPPPWTNQIRYHGVLGPNARLRSAIVPTTTPPTTDEKITACCRPKRFSWAELMQRVHAIDVLQCPKCDGKMAVIAAILDRGVARRILQSCGMAQGPPPTFAPARAARQEQLFFDEWA